MTDVMTFIERVKDAYDYDEFLEIILEDDRILLAIYRLFPELLDDEETGED